MDFLDVTLDLNNGEYRPYHKPNNTPLYVHAHSNHPPSVLRQIPLTVQQRLSSLSSTEDVFNREKQFYETALKNAGYDVTLKYQQPIPKPSRKRRPRKVIWFNPPFCRSVKTGISQEFLKLIDTCFHRDHTLHKIFNRNTIKVSPSCMPNVRAIISATNKQKLNQERQQQPRQDPACNCRQNPCPLGGQCSVKDIIYKAEIRNVPNSNFFYYGSTARKFIERFHIHKHSLRHRESRNGTSLSKKVWQLRDQGHRPNVSFSIFKRSHSAGTCAPRCNLCLTEKQVIIHEGSPDMLNARSEIFSKCKHRNRWKVGMLL